MPYTVQQLATLAGVTPRTLHHYDAIGLLTPARVLKNGYRQYDENQLLILQQILFFRELDFSLEEIARILSSPTFDMQQALADQKNMLELKRKRLGRLIKTIDQTLTNLINKTPMEDTDLYGSFSQEEMDAYTEEARKRWGGSNAFAQSQERVKKMGKAGLQKVVRENDLLNQKIAQAMNDNASPKSSEVQELISRHYEGLRSFYEPTLDLYQGLAELYVTDPKFKATYEKVAPGLAQFMHDAMKQYIATMRK